MNGCGLVAGLGDPKQPAQAATSGAYSAQQVAVGRTHACAIVAVGQTDERDVLCWGSNGAGQLGNPSGAMTYTPTRVALPALQGGPSESFDPFELSLSGDSSCAISRQNYLACWGAMPGTQAAGVHREQSSPSYEPSFVKDSSKLIFPVEVASLGANGGCLVFNQALTCWGEPIFEVGVDAGTTVTPRNYRSVAVGTSSACVISSATGAVECWGDNRYGQCGAPAGGLVTFPQDVALGGHLKQVAVGGDFACALRESGSIFCWGRNDSGQLGPAESRGSSATPVEIPGIQASALALGDRHACALLTNGDETVTCWGDNANGQLGRGPSAPARSALPSIVQRAAPHGGTEDMPHVQEISAGGDTTCVVRATSPQVSCWGQNTSGQAGQKPSAQVDLATPVAW